MSADSKPQDRTNLRLPSETLAAVDAACAARPGAVSRNTWISEAVAEKLHRERKALQASGATRVA